MSVSTAFLQALLSRELVNIAHEQLRLTDHNIMQKEHLVENGKLASGELLELQAQQSREEMKFLEAENNLAYSLLELAQILELGDLGKIDVAVPDGLQGNELQLLDPETVYRQAITHRPEVLGAEYKLQSSHTNVKLARSAYFPEITFDAGVGQTVYNGVTTPFSSNLRFTLAVPIFDKLSTANNVKQAKLDVENSRLALESTKLEMRKTIQQVYANAIAAKARWTAAIKSEHASAEAFRYATQKYEHSRATVYELYQAKNNHTNAQSELTQAKYEYAFRLKIMELYAKPYKLP
jgi:outer membrane protein